MTGTAATESTEFESIYKLKVTIVPTNKPMIRKVSPSDPFILEISTVLLVFFFATQIVKHNHFMWSEEANKELC